MDQGLHDAIKCIVLFCDLVLVIGYILHCTGKCVVFILLAGYVSLITVVICIIFSILCISCSGYDILNVFYESLTS